jgi:hypothetical protein
MTLKGAKRLPRQKRLLPGSLKSWIAELVPTLEHRRNTMTDAAGNASSGDIVARADFQYRIRVYIFFLMFFGYGLWSLYDGFINWPRENAERAAMEARGERAPQQHNDMSLMINRGLGILLTGISVPLFVWLMYRSRGEYRLSGQTLAVPGHRAVSIDQIRKLDMTNFDRKGVAVAEYELPDATTRQITLRDMVYDRGKTDEIVRRIETQLNPPEPSAAGEKLSPGAEPV